MMISPPFLTFFRIKNEQIRKGNTLNPNKTILFHQNPKALFLVSIPLCFGFLLSPPSCLLFHTYFSVSEDGSMPESFSRFHAIFFYLFTHIFLDVVFLMLLLMVFYSLLFTELCQDGTRPFLPSFFGSFDCFHVKSNS